MKLWIESDSENEKFARTAVAAYVARLNPTLEEMADIKTAVSEAVTNSIIHGYGVEKGTIEITCSLQENILEISIKDHGIGIPDVEKAMEPLYTSKPEWERSGMGFSFMEAFTDDLQVVSKVGEGTQVIMRKEFGKEQV